MLMRARLCTTQSPSMDGGIRPHGVSTGRSILSKKMGEEDWERKGSISRQSWRNQFPINGKLQLDERRRDEPCGTGAGRLSRAMAFTGASCETREVARRGRPKPTEWGKARGKGLTHRWW